MEIPILLDCPTDILDGLYVQFIIIFGRVKNNAASQSRLLESENFNLEFTVKFGFRLLVPGHLLHPNILTSFYMAGTIKNLLQRQGWQSIDLLNVVSNGDRNGDFSVQFFRDGLYLLRVSFLKFICKNLHLDQILKIMSGSLTGLSCLLIWQRHILIFLIYSPLSSMYSISLDHAHLIITLSRTLNADKNRILFKIKYAYLALLQPQLSCI